MQLLSKERLQHSCLPVRAHYEIFKDYATFKVRTFGLLFHKINTFLQKTTSSIRLQAEQILSVNIQYTYFFNFRHGFCGSFSMLFPKAPASCGKKNLK